MIATLEWRPHAGQQTRFLSSPAFEALFGGAAGPGKSDCLLMESLRQIDNRRYNAILLRRTFNRLEGADGLIARSLRWFPGYGGRYNEQKHVWKFPSGSRIYFGHMEHEGDKQQYQGSQFTYIAFDELTEFTESQYIYLFTRCRADPDSGLRCYVRAATNPGNDGHEWVKRRFITTDITNRIRHFAMIGNKDAVVEADHPDALSRAFYPALLADNPNADPEYRKRILMNPDPVERARLLGGDWEISSSDGQVYANWSFLNIDGDIAFNPRLRTVWGVDDGYAYGQGPGTESYHPRVVLVMQVTELGGINILDEYCETGVTDYNTTIDDVLELGYPKPEIAYVDSSAAMFKGALHQRDIAATGATHEVVEGIKNLRRLICDANGVRLLKVHPRCVNFIREISAYRKDPKNRGKGGEALPMKLDDHCPDAARYGAWHLRWNM